jgi:hypothetical protein
VNCILHEGTLWYEYSILYHRFSHWLINQILEDQNPIYCDRLWFDKSSIYHMQKKIYQIIAYRSILDFDPPGFDWLTNGKIDGIKLNIHITMFLHAKYNSHSWFFRRIIWIFWWNYIWQELSLWNRDSILYKWRHQVPWAVSPWVPKYRLQ